MQTRTYEALRHLAVDVHYVDNIGKAAGLTFHDWESPIADETFAVCTKGIASYQPGSFYLRELPCLQRLIEHVRFPISTIVIDGYVSLGDRQKPGLGMHLWSWLGGRVPIIGVAKSAFPGTPSEALVFRGNSKRPLFISAIGVSLEDAKNCILRMHGAHRIPTLLREVDRACRYPCIGKSCNDLTQRSEIE